MVRPPYRVLGCLFTKCVRLQVFQATDLERARVRRLQDHFRRHARLECLLPTRRAQAPLIAGLQAWKAVLGDRRREVVPARLRKRQEGARDATTHGVRTVIVGTGATASVAKETRHRVFGTKLESPSEHVGLSQLNHEYSLVASGLATRLLTDLANSSTSPRHSAGCPAPQDRAHLGRVRHDQEIQHQHEDRDSIPLGEHREVKCRDSQADR